MTLVEDGGDPSRWLSMTSTRDELAKEIIALGRGAESHFSWGNCGSAAEIGGSLSSAARRTWQAHQVSGEAVALRCGHAAGARRICAARHDRRGRHGATSTNLPEEDSKLADFFRNVGSATKTGSASKLVVWPVQALPSPNKIPLRCRYSLLFSWGVP